MFKGKVEIGRFDFEKLASNARDALARVHARRSQSMAEAMTVGLHTAAARAEQTAKIVGEETESLTRVVDDAEQIEFESREGPTTIVGGVEHRRSVVSPAGETGKKSGLTPEQVSRAFEFGSVAHGVPATAFSQAVVDQQRRESAKDIEEVAKAIR